MRQEDYIVRQLRQFTQILAQVLFRKKNEQYQEALAEIQQSGQLFLGLDLGAVHTLTYEVLRDALRGRSAQDAGHASVVAELLRHQGDCFFHEDRPDDARRSYALALDLYLDLYTSGQAAQFVDHTARIDALLAHFDPLALSPGTRLMLFRYYDAVGRYADAEDMLFRLAEEAPDDALFAEGVAFFERLLGKSYRYLHAGNLPYDEVKEGLAAFRQKFEPLRPGSAG